MTTNERRRELADSSLILSQTGTQEGVPHADLTSVAKLLIRTLPHYAAFIVNDPVLVLEPVSYLFAVWPWEGYLHFVHSSFSIIISGGGGGSGGSNSNKNNSDSCVE